MNRSRRLMCFAVLLALPCVAARAAGQVVQTPYKAPMKVVFEFYLDDPSTISNALFWVRSVFNTLQQSPYDVAPEDVLAVVVLHGTEIAATATRNQDTYREAVERMRYDAQMGVKFKVCGQAAHDFGYTPADFQDFIEIVPNAMTELAYWQQQGYALIIPRILIKREATEKIR
ncbi:MAG: DsrE family protein [Thiomonas sp.]|nr:DsrE family protein [Thiomonas sp.]